MSAKQSLELRISELTKLVDSEKLKLRVSRNTCSQLRKEIETHKVVTKRLRLALAHYRKHAHENGAISKIEAGIAQHMEKEGL